MKKTLLLLILSGLFFLSNEAFSQQIITTTDCTNPMNCDGTAVFTDSTSINQNTTTWNGNGVVIQTGGYSLSGLCAGTYVVTYTNALGTYSYTFIINNGTTNPCANFYLTISTINSSDSLSCNGSVVVAASGGTAPYTYNWSNGSTTQFISNLCPSIYYCTVMDMNGCSSTITGFVEDSSSIDTMVIINNPTYLDSTVIDTLGNQWVVDCITDFMAVDSAFISNYGYINIDSVFVTWTLIDTNGLVVYVITVPYAAGNQANGVYSTTLTLYCTQKSTEMDYLQATDKIYLNSSQMTLTENTESDFTVNNPFENTLQLMFKESNDLIIEIMDIKGSCVYSVNAKQVSEWNIDTTKFEKGAYFLHVINGNTQTVRKLIK